MALRIEFITAQHSILRCQRIQVPPVRGSGGRTFNHKDYDVRGPSPDLPSESTPIWKTLKAGLMIQIKIRAKRSMYIYDQSI
ncbi:MAG: hypothetical protein VW226_09250 [Rhodospirillaceae bacterium]